MYKIKKNNKNEQWVTLTEWEINTLNECIFEMYNIHIRMYIYIILLYITNRLMSTNV